MRIRVILAAVVVGLVALTAACSTTVNGSGRAVSAGRSDGFPQPTDGVPNPTDTPTGTPRDTTGASGAPSVPTGPATPPRPSNSGSAPAGRFRCPTITYPPAHLRFDCIVDGMSLNSDHQVWPVSMYKTVEQSTGWVLEEGAGDWGDPGSAAPEAIALEVRGQMIAAGSYGTSPTVRTDRSSNTRIGGVAAHVLQTTIRLNPTWARSRGTKVTSEKLWIVVMKVSGNDAALWYTSIPNLTAQLWPKVPAVLKTIEVG